MSEYLSYKEATERVGYSDYTLSKWVKDGKLDRYQFAGKYYFRVDELDDAAAVHDPRGDLCFTDDYNHLRDFDLTHDRIAEQMGMSTEFLISRALKLGIYRPGRYERQASVVLDRLIDSGEAFTSEMLPCTFDARLAGVLVARAAAARRVRVVGKRTSQMMKTGIKVNVYEGVAA
ncbi:helix-turn-helix domain-containing protein [Rhodococcus fascians]|nr:helix-turn-helix domain-containing protein [Rhodococcus fascians]MBY4237710.1 helix-turn-helix domain-containing protein [Rhodococcus fascians]MBY4253913.1 helix-turn-helix domain-containing protein [Rhodococcus fascians]MBY4269216.1 helix-turn-helix domain-containing protein [Rhodococcus fascians]